MEQPIKKTVVIDGKEVEVTVCPTAHAEGAGRLSGAYGLNSSNNVGITVSSEGAITECRSSRGNAGLTCESQFD